MALSVAKPMRRPPPSMGFAEPQPILRILGSSFVVSTVETKHFGGNAINETPWPNRLAFETNSLNALSPKLKGKGPKPPSP
jgi:hypothetical protein